jgi:apolipoprotein N-acyltransferase
MVCYDNAFPGVIEQHVAAGASFLVVVSNEAWYQGGAELDQMVAMTVCRALECRVPIVRCTVDGASVVVGRDGRVTAALAVSGRNRTSTQILAVDLPVSARGHRTVPWLHPWVRWLVLLSALGLAIPLTRIGGRLMRSPASGDRVQSSDLARPAAGS